MYKHTYIHTTSSPSFKCMYFRYNLHHHHHHHHDHRDVKGCQKRGGPVWTHSRPLGDHQGEATEREQTWKGGDSYSQFISFFENFFSKSWFIGWQWRWRRRKEMKVLLFLPKRNKIKWQLIATRKHGCNKILKVDRIALNQIPCEHDDQCLSLSMERLSFVTTKWITAWSDTQHYGAPPATNIQTLTLLYIVDIIIISSIIKVTHHRHNQQPANILGC